MTMVQATDTARRGATPRWSPQTGRPENPARGAGQPDVTLFEVAPEGRSWLIKPNRGVLGRVADEVEAIQIASGLAAWCEAQGRLVSFQPE